MSSLHFLSYGLHRAEPLYVMETAHGHESAESKHGALTVDEVYESQDTVLLDSKLSALVGGLHLNEHAYGLWTVDGRSLLVKLGG